MDFKQRVLVLVVFLFILSFIFRTDTLADSTLSVVYIMPSGYPFDKPSLSGRRIYSIKLKFGTNLPVMKVFHNDDLTWFLCSMGKRFFLPESFVYWKGRVIYGVYDKSMDAPMTGTGFGSSTDNSIKPNMAESEHEISHLSEKSGWFSEKSDVGLDFSVDRWHPVPIFYEPGDLVKIPIKFRAPGSENKDLRLRSEALDWFVKMIEDAGMNGVEIKIISAYRSSYYQAWLYKRAIRNYGIDQTWVAKPGYSEHQLGTTCDLGTGESGYKLTVEFEKTKAYQWLMENSYRYGIYLSYTENSSWLKGYNYEPWHFRYWGKSRFESAKYDSETFFTR